jgi:hypothetical protein
MVLVIMAYALYAGGMAVWRYFLLSNIVEEALNRELPTLTERQLSGVGIKAEPGDRMARVHEAVLKAAGLADVPLSAEEVAVSADSNVLTVRIRHAYSALPSRIPQPAIHLTVERSLAIP